MKNIQKLLILLAFLMISAGCERNDWSKNIKVILPKSEILYINNERGVAVIKSENDYYVIELENFDSNQKIIKLNNCNSKTYEGIPADGYDRENLNKIKS